MKIMFNPATKTQIEMFLSNPSHGLGLAGERGTGKEYTACYIASSVLGIKQSELASHPYYKIVNAGGKEGIESVRELQRFLSLKVPGAEKIKRVVAVTDIESFRHEAQNALLKTLEEPPADTMIIVTSYYFANLLDTIKSRLQWINVKPISLDLAMKELKSKHKEPEIQKAWMISQGDVGLLTSLLDEGNNHPLVEAIGYAKKILARSAYERIAEVDRITKDKNFDLDLILDAMYRLLYSTLQQGLSSGATKNEILKRKNRLQKIIKARDYSDAKVQPKLLLTNLFYSL